MIKIADTSDMEASKKGWDLADAVAEGWDGATATTYLKERATTWEPNAAAPYSEPPLPVEEDEAYTGSTPDDEGNPQSKSGQDAGPYDYAEEPPDWCVEAIATEKPRLLIQHNDPHLTVADLRDILSETGELFDRGVPVRIAIDQTQDGAIAQIMGPDALVMMAHQVCRPYKFEEDKKGNFIEVDTRLSKPYPVMYLAWLGEWQLQLLNGIASAPLLDNNGAIHSTVGYDRTTGMWCEKVPAMTGLIPEQPNEAEAAASLQLIRDTFKTFCFADAETIYDSALGLDVVDISKPPGKDESAFLVILLTAVCRPSLHLAPGALFKAAPMSGAGTGKGLLARCICMIAFGRKPHAVTKGGTSEELEKRIVAELIQGGPSLFLDNLNNTEFKSDLLASAITERPARVRVLQKSQMVPLNASAFVILTGNGLSVSEDLARRFIETNFDDGSEDPEERTFDNDILADVRKRRAELLAALLVIWRWGRLAKVIEPGKTLGSFEQWGSWVRDPLLALGCKDPVDRVSEAKRRDGRRQEIAELFEIWWDRHGDRPMTISNLDSTVKAVIDPQKRGRQYQSARFQKLDGTRMAGFFLTRQIPAGNWGAATYALEKTDGPERHRDHRDHGSHLEAESLQQSPDAPYDPYASSDPTESLPPESPPERAQQRYQGR